MEETIKVDAYTDDVLWGQYARLCIQVEADKPLQTKLRLRDHVQTIVYEGINHIFFKLW